MPAIVCACTGRCKVPPYTCSGEHQLTLEAPPWWARDFLVHLRRTAQPETGWICPACGRGVAPDVQHCDHGQLQLDATGITAGVGPVLGKIS